MLRLPQIAQRCSRSLTTTGSIRSFSTVRIQQQSSSSAEEWVPINADGTLKKKIIKEGTGGSPPNRSYVKVHYTGTLPDHGNRKFDSSKDRNEPFEFTLGAGEVITGWDLGVKTMKQGEICVLSVPSKHAYGPGGIPGVIPGGATLNFEVELIGWK